MKRVSILLPMVIMLIPYLYMYYVGTWRDGHRHHCEWTSSDSTGSSKPCQFEGKWIFESKEEEGTDAYYFERNHFFHPEWSEDQCDTFIDVKTDDHE